MMNGFGDLWRIRTRKHIRTMRSLRTQTGSARALWPRLQESERQKVEMERLRKRRRLHAQRWALGWKGELRYG
jgi:hypothetical protein